MYKICKSCKHCEICRVWQELVNNKVNIAADDEYCVEYTLAEDNN